MDNHPVDRILSLPVISEINRTLCQSWVFLVQLQNLNPFRNSLQTMWSLSESDSAFLCESELLKILLSTSHMSLLEVFQGNAVLHLNPFEAVKHFIWITQTQTPPSDSFRGTSIVPPSDHSEALWWRLFLESERQLWDIQSSFHIVISARKIYFH